MAANLECPVDFKLINGNKVRVIAALVLLLALLYLFTGRVIFIALLVIDFAARAFDFGKYSPLAYVADYVVSALSIPNKLTDQGPKRFAAKIGLVLSSIILLLHLADQPAVPFYLAGVLTLFSFLESAFGFCAGCQVYTFYKRVLRPSAA